MTAAGGSAAAGRSSAGRPRHVWVPPRADIALAAALCLVDSLTFAGLPDLPPGLNVAYVVAGYLPLIWRRAAPRLVFAVLLLHPVIAAIWTPEYRPTFNVLIALFTVAAALDVRTSLACLAAAITVIASTSVVEELRADTEMRMSSMSTPSVIAFVVTIYVVLCGTAWAIGFWARSSRRTVRGLEERRRRAATEAITAERQRVARELHDIVSHSVSVIVLQAAGARGMISADPARASEALSNIEEVGRQTMGELRRLLGVLHDGAIAGPEQAEALGTPPGLAELDPLLERVRLGGLAVRMEIEGHASPLDPSVDLSAYRIVQEALTNSLKHAGPGTAATVRLIWTPDQLTLRITDDGDGGGGINLSTGHGLPGLRERARAVGGDLEAQAITGGGFQVIATLPVSRIAAATARRSPAGTSHA